MSVEWERFSVPAEWDEGPPPALAPVPAVHMPALAVEDEVTIGVPGGPWLHDQVVVSAGAAAQPWRGEAQACVQVASPAAWWAHRTWPDDAWRPQWWPLALTWVYRDVQALATTGSAPSWLDALAPSAQEPPVRRPVPARTAGPLTGRRVRLWLDGEGWAWRVAVTEPHDDDGDIVVAVAALSAWAVAPARLAEFGPEHLGTVELHRLWVQ